ncbi:hypothetical protein K2173_026600 [Erythroxylum novogranatense]|uniref:Uncharacterized protein n=1 Tax=Erythroxylum novogranatense TaxID=1862640 RepID=A0AAV8U0G9_9ROSI|nr:hypothetical protein K2173_026600 [Erythroxylum novogranatense]
MKKRLSLCLRNLLSCNNVKAPSHQNDVDVREEYANAFRTESYIEFWTRVVALSDTNVTSSYKSPVDSTTAARLPSYRLFVEHLLDPDQPTVTRTLKLLHIPDTIHSLLSEYFLQTSHASLLFGSLLKEIDHVRIKYRSFETSVQLHESDPFWVLSEFANSLNPFGQSSSSQIRVVEIQAQCSKLLKQLESTRHRTKAKLNLKSKLKHGSAIFLVALTASLVIIVTTHALALLVATPSLVAFSLDSASIKSLARVWSQLDAAAKGTYILSRDLETISRIVDRINHEMEHMKDTVRFWVQRGEDCVQAGAGEVMRRMKQDCEFSQQLDELEEHLYLCFMTINRARNLVLKEILDPGQSKTNP